MYIYKGIYNNQSLSIILGSLLEDSRGFGSYKKDNKRHTLTF